jgi:hypothetical protein
LGNNDWDGDNSRKLEPTDIIYIDSTVLKMEFDRKYQICAAFTKGMSEIIGQPRGAYQIPPFVMGVRKIAAHSSI